MVGKFGGEDGEERGRLEDIYIHALVLLSSENLLFVFNNALYRRIEVLS